MLPSTFRYCLLQEVNSFFYFRKIFLISYSIDTDLISSETFKKCKKGVKIINVARGGVINEEAILEALKDGACGGAAFDVFQEEPPVSEVTKKLIQHPKVVATPHLGASTKEAQIKVAVEVSEQFIALTGKSKEFTQYMGVVNRPVLKNFF